jgi:hypothetical protein
MLWVHKYRYGCRISIFVSFSFKLLFLLSNHLFSFREHIINVPASAFCRFKNCLIFSKTFLTDPIFILNSVNKSFLLIRFAFRLRNFFRNFLSSSLNLFTSKFMFDILGCVQIWKSNHFLLQVILLLCTSRRPHFLI